MLFRYHLLHVGPFHIIKTKQLELSKWFIAWVMSHPPTWVGYHSQPIGLWIELGIILCLYIWQFFITIMSRMSDQLCYHKSKVVRIQSDHGLCVSCYIYVPLWSGGDAKSSRPWNITYWLPFKLPWSVMPSSSSVMALSQLKKISPLCSKHVMV